MLWKFILIWVVFGVLVSNFIIELCMRWYDWSVHRAPMLMPPQLHLYIHEICFESFRGTLQIRVSVSTTKCVFLRVWALPEHCFGLASDGIEFFHWLFVLIHSKANRQMIYKHFNRLTITASCPMNLEYFPMDRQLCQIEIESCEYFSWIYQFQHLHCAHISIN